MAVSLSEWLVMASLGVGSFVIGSVPYFLMRKLRMKNVFDHVVYNLSLTVLACGGGGVLLATTLVHMLPENRMSLAALESVSSLMNDHFPLAEILTLGGFILIYFLEEVAIFIVEVTGQGGHGHSHSRSGHSDLDHEKRRPSFLSIQVSSRTNVQYNVDVDSLPSTPQSPTDSKADLIFPVEEHDTEESGDSAKSQLGSMFAFAALSFHAVMEGIAIGLQNSSNLWLMFGAIATHKFIISFCMGMELCAAKAKLKMYYGSIFLFSILSPIGILIGSVLTAESSVKSLPVSVLESFTTGTLLYVVFFEILSRERQRRHDTVLSSKRLTGFLQFSGVCVGLTLMICLLTMVDHGHNTVVGLPTPA